MNNSTENRPRWWKSNYSFREKWNFLKYRIKVPKTSPFCNLSNSLQIDNLSFSNKKPYYSIVFIGDFMPIGNLKLILSERLKSFIVSADTIVVNLEGIITNQKRVLALSHNKECLKTIRKLNPNNIVINLANNHSSDFGIDGFNAHLKLIEDNGFSIVGIDKKHLILQDRFLLYASSLWSNQDIFTSNRFSLQDRIISPPPSASAEYYKIFLPHWGYEMELFPTKTQVQYAHNLIDVGWNSVIGNHTHCPQPIQVKNQNIIAYSLGNFCYKNNNPNHWYGVALKLDFHFENDKTQLNKIERLFTLQQLSSKYITITDTKVVDYYEIKKKQSTKWSYIKDLLK